MSVQQASAIESESAPEFASSSRASSGRPLLRQYDDLLREKVRARLLAGFRESYLLTG